VIFRALVNQQRRLEKETYLIQKAQLEEAFSELLQAQRSALEQQVELQFFFPHATLE